MRESIGSKGGSSDKKRVLIIAKNKKKKLEKNNENIKNKKIKELEKKVRKIQIINFLTAVPLVISANSAKTFFGNCKVISDKNHNLKKDNNINKNIVEEFQEEIINTENLETKKEELISKKEIENIVSTSIQKKEKKINKKIEILPIVIIPFEDILLKKEKHKESKKETKKIDEEQKEIISKDVDKKIIQKYGDELKKVRTQLKEIAYSNIEYEEYSIKAKELLDKLNIVIKKLDEFGNMIKISKIGDEVYYYDLALKYIEEFNNGSIVLDIKDSDLYIEIANKLKTIDSKKEQLRKEILKKQIGATINNNLIIKKEQDDFDYEEFVVDIEKIQNLQEDTIDNLTNENIEFQKETKYEDKKVDTKIKKEKSNNKNKEENKKEQLNSDIDIVIFKAKELNKYCEALLSTIKKANMRRPSVRSTKAVAVTTLIATYFMKRIIKNKFIIRKKKKIRKIDYSKYIENSIPDIDNVISLIKLASSKIDSLINEITSKYKGYLYLDELQELLANLNNIKDEILEKEYEIENIKNKQKSNNQKIK